MFSTENIKQNTYSIQNKFKTHNLKVEKNIKLSSEVVKKDYHSNAIAQQVIPACLFLLSTYLIFF